LNRFILAIGYRDNWAAATPYNLELEVIPNGHTQESSGAYQILAPPVGGISSLLSATIQTKASIHKTFQANGPMLYCIEMLPQPLTLTLDCAGSLEGFEYTVSELSRNATFGGWEYWQATASR
jgi:hypothetical protein